MGTVLFTKTQQRVLSVIFGDVDESFTVTEIIKAARCGSGSVQREIAKLSKGGLITMTPVGNQKRYQANDAAPIFDEIRRIVMKTTSGASRPAPRIEVRESNDGEFVD